MIRLIENLDSPCIADLIAEIPTCDLKHTSVLARNHKLLQRLDDELTEREIPHTYIGRKTSIIESEPFRRFHAFLKLLVNPYDNFSFLLIRDVIGLDAKDYAATRLHAARTGQSHFQAWNESQDGGRWNDYFALSAEDLCEVLDSLTQHLDLDHDCTWHHVPFAFVNQYLIQNGIGTVLDYLTWLATYDSQDEYEDAQGVTLATIHAAKGLEWHTVIVAGCNEGILPSKRSLGEDGGLEEERRLMYVAMTRARDQLVLAVRPEVTEKHGKVYEAPKSRFLAEAL